MAKGFKTGGRQKGTPNKATKAVKEMAENYGQAAIDRLAYLMENATSEQAQVSACKEILDRAYGKATQSHELSGKDGSPIEISEVDRMEVARRMAHVLMEANQPCQKH